jgi:hypothetical protein
LKKSLSGGRYLQMLPRRVGVLLGQSAFPSAWT